MKKEDDCYCEPEKLVHSYLELEKSSLQLFGARKKRMTAIASQKNWFTAIWSSKKVVYNTLEQEKRG